MFFGSSGKFADLVPLMVKHKTERFFVPVSDVHTDEISKALDEKNLQHKEGVMYRTVSNDFSGDEPFDFDMVIFFSPSGIQSLLKNIPDFEQGKIAIGTFGPTTAKAVKDAGLRLDLEAPSPQYPSITAALNAYIAEANK